jgi:DNA-binding XRE family transcriptional regulator
MSGQSGKKTGQFDSMVGQSENKVGHSEKGFNKMRGLEYREIRERMGWSKAELAKKVGVSVQTIYRREAMAEVELEAEYTILYLSGKGGTAQPVRRSSLQDYFPR